MQKKRIWMMATLLFFASCGAAWAEGRYKTIEVFFDRIQMKVNGSATELNRDSMIYNGSVYVPLRSLSEMLGAEVSWDSATQTVNLDFITPMGDMVTTTVQQGLLQFIVIENNSIMKDMIAYTKNEDMDSMKTVVERFDKLQQLSTDIGEKELAELYGKLSASVEIIRSGWTNGNMDDYYLASVIFSKNATLINTTLRNKLKDDRKPGGDIIQINPLDNPGAPRN